MILPTPSCFPPHPPLKPNPLRRSPNSVPSPTFLSPPSLAGSRRRSRSCLRVGGGVPGDENVESVESVGTGRSKFRGGGGGGEQSEVNSWRSEKRRWWSDDSSGEADAYFDDFDDDPLEQDPWDAIWIFKVFKSYGYLLPAIIASMLLATGPKAFLMALALPLGQSAISLAIDKLWGKAREGPRTKPKSRKRQFTRSNWSHSRRWQDKNSYDEEGRTGYQSWASVDTNNGDKEKTCEPSLGGWDELDWQGGSTNGFVRQPKPSPTNRSTRPEAVKKGKLSKGGGYKDAPVFIRLLIAVFPFLASWTRILW